MFENTALEDGANRVREAFGSIEDELQRVQKDLKRRRTRFEKQLGIRRKQIEKRARKLRAQIEKNPTVKRLETARKDARKQLSQGVDDLLDTLSIASKNDVQRIDRKISQLNRKLREMEKAATAR